MRLKKPHFLRSPLALILILALPGCGGGGSTNPNPQPTPTPVPIPTPTPTPTPFASLCGSPSPPPLYGVRVKVQTVVNQARWQLDSRPLVLNVDGYCEKVGLDGKYCDTRPEGNIQREACDALVMGNARDTGRPGPTWTGDDKPCLSSGDTSSQAGCINHVSNQFLVIARGAATYEACATDAWPLAEEGTRCGNCVLKSGADGC